MANIKSEFGTETTMTVTLTSIANTTGGRETTVVDNTSNKFLDAIVQVSTNGASSGTALVDVYVYGSLGSTNYTDGATGSDAAFTVANIKNAKYLDSIQMNAATAVVGAILRSVASALGGPLPPKWGLIFVNKSGAALSATGGDHVVKFVGLYATSA